jgi:hypothetical protein
MQTQQQTTTPPQDGRHYPRKKLWATADVQRRNQRRFIWKNSKPPPVEKVTVMEERVAEHFEELVEAY